tara:strand:+ start:767 stop:1753 length:987 start_codon:yes stop_codon:yes gene_type:complete
MLREDWRHEFSGGLYQDILVKQALSKNIPSLGNIFSESVSNAFFDNTFMHGADYFETIDESSPKTVLTEEEWNMSPYARKQLKWHEGITETQAKVFSERFDRESFYAQYTQNVDAFHPARIAGMIVGGIPDPINYIPFVGIAGKVSKIARIVDKMPVLGMTANAMFGQTAFETVKWSTINKMGGEVDYKGAILDVAIAGLIGTGAGLLFGGVGKKSGLQKRIGMNEYTNDLIVSEVFTNDRIPVTNRGQNLITSIDDPVNTLTPPTIKEPPIINRNEEIINHEQVINNKIDETIKVNPTDKVGIVKQTLEKMTNVLRTAKSCTLNLFK